VGEFEVAAGVPCDLGSNIASVSDAGWRKKHQLHVCLSNDSVLPSPGYDVELARVHREAT
jgi:hypothetical protein